MAPQTLVTGAAGFIGSHLVDRLLGQGCRVIGVDDLSLGRHSNLSRALADERFHFLEGDLNEPACLDRLAAACGDRPLETVWHLAANSDIKSGADSDADLRNTLLTTVQVLKLMRARGMRRIVFASTSAIYGDLGRELTEDIGPLFPISNYGAFKLASEAVISAAVESFLEQAWICRFPNVVGSRSTHGAIHDFVERLRQNAEELVVLGDGRQTKPYLHVDELLDAMLFIRQNASDRINYFNIGPYGEGASVAFMADAVVRLVAPAARIRYTGGAKGWVGDVARFEYSIQKLARLGWKPRLSSREAVLRAAKEIAADEAS